LVAVLTGEVHIIPMDGTNISQFKDSLQAAALLYGLEPVFDGPFISKTKPLEIERRRGQRNASAILRSPSHRQGDLALQLIVTNEDLFVERMNFVFGLADRDLRAAIVSVKRLVEWRDGLTPSQIQERILKEAAHERIVSHVFLRNFGESRLETSESLCRLPVKS
jgi:hypothetical protein